MKLNARLKHTHLVLSSLAGLLLACNAFAAESKPVGITADMMSVTVKHGDKMVEIKRNQDPENTISPDFAKTSRACPPFCVQPMIAAEGVATLGEAEVIEYIKTMSAGDDSIVLIDSRTPDWVEKGTIPGAVNVSWKQLTPSQGATTAGIVTVMTEQFGVKIYEDKDAFDVDDAIVAGDTSEIFDFTNAKTLVLFCNGMWCGQSPMSIQALIKFGYPAEKLKYFRGGMQTWEILGLTTVK